MEKENSFYPALTSDGVALADKLIKEFEFEIKEKAAKIIESTVSSFYCNILPYIESDSWSNYRTSILNAICDYSRRDESPNDFKRIRMSIYNNHKDEIVADLNQDLIAEIDRLNSVINNHAKHKL